MPQPHRGQQAGFTLLEVTFASGIPLLAFGLVLGSLFSLTIAQESTEVRLKTINHLHDCLEQIQHMRPPDAMTFHPEASGPYRLQTELEFFDQAGNPLAGDAVPALLLVRVSVTAHTSRGVPVRARAVCMTGGGEDAT